MKSFYASLLDKSIYHKLISYLPFTRTLFTLIFLLSVSVGAQTLLPINRIDSVFIDIDRLDSPGCALVILYDDELVYARGYGSSNLDYKIPIDSTTVMNIGSVTKQFVAAGVLKASIQGYLSLDDDIRKWLSGFPDYGETITINHLIHHTSGIRDELQLRAVGNLSENMTRKESVELLSRQKALNFKPGEKHLYSNGGYLLLTEILELATGKSVHEYLSAEFFQPLGLTSAYFGRNIGIIPQASSSYFQEGNEFKRKSHVGDVEGVHINSLDLGRWMTALKSDKIGPKGFLELQLQKGILNNGDTIDYSFGLDVMLHRGIPVIKHGGADSGYRAGMAIYPDQNLALCALCNLSNLDAVYRIWQVAEILLEDEMDPIRADSSAGGYSSYWPLPPGESIQLNSNQIKELVGRYFSPELNVIFHVLEENEGIRVGPEGWMRPMFPTSKIDLFNDGRGWAQIRFDRDDQGTVTGFKMDIGRVNGLIMKKVFDEDKSKN